MAVELGTSGDLLTRTTDLPDINSAYTWMFWLRLSTAVTGFTRNVRMDTSDGGYDRISFGTDGTLQLALADGSGGFSGSPAVTITAAVWLHVTFVRLNDSQVRLYTDGVDRGTTTSDLDMSGRAAADEHTLQPNFANFEFSAQKFWNTALSAAEIRAEMHSLTPRAKLADVYAFWPHLRGFPSKDYSGNGRDFTEGGTPASVAPPPLAWGRATTHAIVPAASGGSVSAHPFMASVF